MKITHEVALAIGFRESAANKPSEKAYILEHKGLIVVLTHYFLGRPGIADLWALERNEVETVADMMAVMYKLGALD